MENTNRSTKAWALAGIFKRINSGENLRVLCDEAVQLSKTLNNKDIVLAKQALIAEGYSHRVVERLSSMLRLMALNEKTHIDPDIELSNNHILRKVKSEHDLFRCYIADLNKIADIIWSLNSITDVSSEFRNLIHVLGHLNAVKEHVDREEDIIFPYLRKAGWANLCQSVTNEHAKIVIDINNLIELTKSFNEIEFDYFKGWLVTIVYRLSPMMLEHFCYEDELLYPVSVVAIDDTDVWERIKALDDLIGYDGTHVLTG